MHETLTAVVTNSALGGRQITILGPDGFAHRWIMLGEREYNMAQLTAILAESGYKRLDAWVASFEGDRFSLRATVKED